MPYKDYQNKLNHNIEYSKFYKKLHKLPSEYFIYLKSKTNCCICNTKLSGLKNKHPYTSKIGIDILCFICYNNNTKN